MVTVNKNYLKLPGSYLFSTIAKKVAAYQEANPDVQIVRLGIGDVTQQYSSAGVRFGRFARSPRPVRAIGLVYSDRKSTRLNSSHSAKSRMPSSA